MSKNRKHRVEPAYLRPKTNDVIQRSIVIEDRVAASHFNHDQGLRQITELLNSFIQTLNFT